MSDQPENRGYVYVLTNEAMPGLVKIGVTRASDPLSRVGTLFTTGVPLPFDLEYAGLVDDPRRVERVLHHAFQQQRVNPNREFFELHPDQAIGVLALIAIEDYTDSARQEAEEGVSEADREALARAKNRRPALNFEVLGIAEGTSLNFVDNEDIIVEVSQPRKVKLSAPPEGYKGVGIDGSDVSLSPLASDLREFLGLGRINGTGSWRLPDGRLLGDVYTEVHGPRG
ncbi:MAG: GIY-YIG nuclease family protein [bacterium]|nr:GIY-YIG nuclease family protein [Acidimicrobiia bacterium]MCY4649816.1 GIY-YIG nuclease family protein [bacterium]